MSVRARQPERPNACAVANHVKRNCLCTQDHHGLAERTLPTGGIAQCATSESMTNAETIASLKERLAQAEANAGRLRQTGSQEQYLEAYFLVQSLESRLDALLALQYGPR